MYTNINKSYYFLSTSAENRLLYGTILRLR